MNQPNQQLINQQLVNLLRNVKTDPTMPNVVIKNPQTGQPLILPNPHYDPKLAQQNQEAVDSELDDEDEEESNGRSWCPIVNNWCPESSLCIYWITHEGEGDDEKEEGCIKIAEIIAKQQESQAKAELYAKATEAVAALLSGDKTSALSSLISNLLTSVQISNEQKILDDSKLGVKSAPAKVAVPAPVAKKDEEPEDFSTEEELLEQ